MVEPMFDNNLTREADLCELSKVADLLGCSEAELQQAIRQGNLPVIPPQSQTLVHFADLQAFIDAGGIEVARPKPRKRRRFFFPFLSS